MSERSIPRWKKPASILTAALCVAYALAALGGWVMLRFAGDRWWPATFLLFSPRWIWIVPAILLLPPALAFRKRWAWLLAVTVLFVLLGQMCFRVPWRSFVMGRGGTQTVRVLTANLHNRQVNPAVLEAFIARTDPDLIALQDYGSAATVAFLRQSGWHVRYESGLLVASRWPLSREGAFGIEHSPRTPEERQRFVPTGAFAACYAIDAPSGAFHLVNLHLSSPHRPLDLMKQEWSIGGQLLQTNSMRRREESESIRRQVAQMGGPFLIAGDFNTPDDSPVFQSAWSDFDDAFDVAGFGFGTTYAKHHTWLRIDHVLFNAGWRCRTCCTSEDIGSGHRAVFAEMAR